MDSRYAPALRGIKADGMLADFFKESTAMLSEEELRDIVNAANYELDKYKKLSLKRPGVLSANSPLKPLIGKRVKELTDTEIAYAISRSYALSKTMLKALKKEKKVRHNGRGEHSVYT